MLKLLAAVAVLVIIVQCAASGAADDVAADQARITNTRTRVVTGAAPGPIEAAAHRAVTQLVAQAAVASPDATATVVTTPSTRGWIARHPILFGALAGAAVGTAVAAAAWGSEGAYVGLYGGAAAGAVVGAVLR